MADSSPKAQLKKLDRELAAIDEKLNEKREEREKIKSKQRSANYQLQNHYKYGIGGTVRKHLGRALTDDDVVNFDLFLQFQEENRNQKNEPGHFFTVFMNNKEYRENLLDKAHIDYKKPDESKDTDVDQTANTGKTN